VSSKAVLVSCLVLASIGGAVFLWSTVGDDAQPAAPDTPTRAPAPAKPPRKPRAERAARPVVLPDAELRALWDAAVALHRSGKTVDALVSLAAPRRASPAFFQDPARAKLLAEMEAAAIAALSRSSRSSDLSATRSLAATLREVLFDPARLAQIDPLLAAAERRGTAIAPEVGADILARITDPKDKAAMEAHLRRFAGRGGAAAKPDWIDDQLAAVERANAAIVTEPLPLPLPDEEAAEQRRLDQLEKLRQRGAIGLLGSIDGALAWLALHQADDGHFGADATEARCAALGHAPACVDGKTKEQFPLAATGLAVLSFLDFRDQDVKRLFEPTLARGVAWMRSRQQPDGSFPPLNARSGSSYSAGIALMALGQAAAVSHDDDLRKAVERGVAFMNRHQGPTGGFRYSLGEAADLSVTGWYVQAYEAARNAKAEVPPDFPQKLDLFVSYAWLGNEKFAYQANTLPKASLSAVGMLSMAILRPDAVASLGEVWRTSLRPAPPGGTNAYTLYYGVRVLLLLDGALPDTWKKQLAVLAANQTTKGTAAGMIALDKDQWFGSRGSTVATAFATLTLEHALYRR